MFPTVSVVFNGQTSVSACVYVCLVIQIGMGIQIRESVDWAFKIDELFDRENLINIVPWIFTYIDHFHGCFLVLQV